MKKLFFTTILSVFVLVLNAQKPVELRLNLQKGNTFEQNMDMKMKIKMDIPGMNIETEMPFFAKISSKVIDIQNNNFILEYTYKEMKMKFDIMGQKMSYDSSDKNQNLDHNPFAKMLSSIINTPYTMTLDKRQNIIAVKGFDKLFASMLNDFPESQKAQMTGILQSMFGDDKIKDNFSSSNIIFPQEPVSVGFSWKTETSQNVQGMSLQVKNVYKVEKLTKTTAEISSVSEYQMDISINENEQQINASLQNSQLKGLYVIDLQTGWTNSAKTKADMTMLLTTNQGGAEISIPMQITMEISVK